MYTFDIKKHMFCDNPEKYEYICKKNYIIDEQASVVEVINGVVLPCRYISKVSNIVEGGVCDELGQFVTGQISKFNDLKNSNWWCDCVKSYKLEKTPVKINDVVVFGGLLNIHFGHFIIDSISRLWYYIKNPTLNYKIVFLNLPGYDGVKFDCILQAIGLKKEQYEIINQPTQFNKIIIPEQTLFRATSYKKECQLVFDAIINNVKPANLKKIYLSKTKYYKANSDRETYFEEFYKKRGFEIIYPETIPFTEQVSILNGADEIVCTIGTLVHLTFFSKNNAKLTILARTSDQPIAVSFMLSVQMRNLKVYCVDISYNFLPVNYLDSTYFFGPTKYWIDYLDSQNVMYDPDEVSFDIHVKPYVYDYLIKWCAHFNQNNSGYDKIKNNKLSDVVNLIHRTFLNETIDVSKFPDRDDVVKLKEDNKKLTNDLSKIRQHTDLKDIAKQTILDMGLPQSFELMEKQIKFNENNLSSIKQENKLLLKENIKLQLEINNLKQEKLKIKSEEKQKYDFKINQLKQQIINMEDTISWHVTKPLRLIKKMFKK